jgi:hypothetical protein
VSVRIDPRRTLSGSALVINTQDRASSSRTQIPGQAARAITRLASGVVSNRCPPASVVGRGGSYSVGYSAPARSAGGWSVSRARMLRGSKA